MKSLFSNLGLKIVALFLAVVVWFVVSAPRRGPVSERTFLAPLALVDLRRDLVITTPVPETVKVRLRGRVSDLRELSSQNLELTVNVSFAMPGEATVTLRSQAVNVPPEIEVVSIDPKELRFRVEQLRQAVVPIRPLLIGNLSPGLMTGEPTLVPDHALISGPSSQIRNVAEVATDRINMTGRAETFAQTVAVVSDSPLVRVVDPVSVTVTVPILATIGPAFPGNTPTTTSGTGETDTQTTTAPDTAARRKTP